MLLDFDDEPLAILWRPPTPLETNDQAMPLDTNAAPVRTLPGRFVPNSARQRNDWMQLAVECDYTFYTTDLDVENGDLLVSADGRHFRVVGIGHRWYAKGSIETFMKYPLLEERFNKAMQAQDVGPPP